jgi:hypothetical protein
MKRIFLLFALILSALTLAGQNSYLQTDTSFTSGARIIEGRYHDYFQKCRVYHEGKTTEYSPYQVTQYGLANGTEYVARDIELQGFSRRVFLEQIVKGKATLYYYVDSQNSLYFIEKDSTTLSVIPKNNNKSDTRLSDFLKEISGDCHAVGEAAGSVKHNRLYLTRFVESYNNCTAMALPQIRYGLILGAGGRKPVLSGNNSDRPLSYFDYRYQIAPAAGLFVNLPVLLSNYSVRIELLYSRSSYSYSASTDEIKYDIEGAINSLKMPLMLRYSHPAPRYRPYINGGLVFAYNIMTDLDLRQESIDGTPVIPVSDYSAFVKKMQPGFTAGGGLEYRVSKKYSIFIDLRYDYLASMAAGSFLNSSGFTLTTGIIL